MVLVTKRQPPQCERAWSWWQESLGRVPIPIPIPIPIGPYPKKNDFSRRVHTAALFAYRGTSLTRNRHPP